MQENWFKDWFNSPYYHLLYQKRDHNEAQVFIDNLIKYLSPSKNAKMLDIACGKGRHSLQLANYGYDVTGIDLSEMSIQEAKNNESELLHFFQHDMRQPFRINYFDYAFNFFTSFGYFKTSNENESAMQTMAEAIKPGGIVVIDYLNVRHVERNMTHQAKETINEIDFTITKWYDDHKFYKKILIEDPKETSPVSYTEEVSRFTLQDFKELFSKQNLQTKAVFGDYNLNKYNEETSPRMIIVAKK